MSYIIFDTQEFFEQLVEAGFEADQAKGMTNAMKRIKLDHVATEHGLRKLEAALAERIAQVDRRITNQIYWYIGTMLAMTGILITVINAYH